MPQHLPAARQHPVVAIWHPDQEGRYQGPKLYRISRQLHHFGSHLLGADRRQSFQVSFSPHSYSASNTAFENYNPQTTRTSQHSVSSSIFSLGTSATNAAELTRRRQGAQDCILLGAATADDRTVTSESSQGSRKRAECQDLPILVSSLKEALQSSEDARREEKALCGT